jgi:hypothetical protein
MKSNTKTLIRSFPSAGVNWKNRAGNSPEIRIAKESSHHWTWNALEKQAKKAHVVKMALY